MSLSNPKLVFVFSGKRKSGKDFLTNELIKMLPENSTVILRLSGPLKKEYADENKLDFSRLLDASEYKENFRAAMVRWGEQKRNEDPGFFCRLAINEYKGEKHPIWIVSDARRTTDLDFFQRAFPKATKLCRVTATDEVREKRGWKFVEGIDDEETECGLDHFKGWDFEMDNSGLIGPHDLLRGCLKLALDTIRKSKEE
ncbi:phosphomevalonate kinase-like [Varroa jacobsoni]|uniref:Phosphomevalonate kinase n=1 Tax=Varroa destructor TaxID=109461 RepID=A0A7M7KEY9_VARDE|nr:phosphomevalonate kinase-like [Varroa destructor]XP_022703892.1 phosphomevalonate kinase-like [Varroa jacobsoni]